MLSRSSFGKLCGLKVAVTLTLLAVFATSDAYAGDWPQILGPQRNGVAVDETIAAWP